MFSQPSVIAIPLTVVIVVIKNSVSVLSGWLNVY